MRNSSHIVSRSAEETLSIGAELGQRLQPGDALLLTGDLGAGKTTLTQGIALGLGVPERPRSPTFVMATEYHGRHAPLPPRPLPRRGNLTSWVTSAWTST